MRAVEFNHVSEKYKIKYIRDKRVSWEEIQALKNVSFFADKGESIGIIGRNGAGKTTILKLIAGIIVPDGGEVKVEGRVSTLMELGAGFNPEFTGRENVLFNAQIYGISPDEIDKKIERIIEFAELGKFIDAPLKYYSQGMYARLAFSLAIHVDPDILVVDDILAVGDEGFQRKCREKIFNLKGENKTIVLVSHDMNTIEKLCDKVIFLDEGEIVNMGSPSEAIACYTETIGKKQGIGVLDNGNLRITFNNGMLFMSYDGKPIGRNQHTYLAFWDENHKAWVSSQGLEWEILDRGDNYILAQGTLGKGLIQTWRIELGDQEVRFGLDIDKDDSYSIRDLHLDCIISEDYKRYIYSSDYFSLNPLSSVNCWKEVFKIREAKSIGCAAEDSNSPYIILEKREDDLLRIFNNVCESEKKAISIWPVDKKIEFSLRFFEERDVFEKNISFSFDNFVKELLERKKRLFKDCSIHSGPLRLFADPQGKAANLFYKDRLITAASGIECTFQYKGKLLNSFYASKFTAYKKDGYLVADLYWDEAFLGQTWKLCFRDNVLFWEVLQNKDSSEEIKNFKMSIMLSSEYKRFFCASQEESFPEEFTYWQDVILKEPFSELFCIRKTQYLPAVVIENSNRTLFFAQNSDSSLSCRVLQMRLTDEAVNRDNFSICQKISFLDDETPIINYIQSQIQRQKEDF